MSCEAPDTTPEAGESPRLNKATRTARRRAKGASPKRPKVLRRLTKIQWTRRTWQVTSGCREWSPGCLNCYARFHARRMGFNPNEKVRKRYEGLVVLKGKDLRWSGEVRELVDQLRLPLGWKAPTSVFIDSLSDLFQEGVSFEFIAGVFAVMAASPQHKFQVLTKRPDRMRAWFEWVASQPEPSGRGPVGSESTVHPFAVLCEAAEKYGLPITVSSLYKQRGGGPAPWPLPNVWLGTSVEDQKRADERVPELVLCPAVIHFLSCEPLLEKVILREGWLTSTFSHCPEETNDPETDECRGCTGNPRDYTHGGDRCFAVWTARIDLVIIGGESGRGARPCNTGWVRSLVEQCTAAGVHKFVKQLGAVVQCDDRDTTLLNVTMQGRWMLKLHDRKGGDMDEWPPDLRVRELPQ